MNKLTQNTKSAKAPKDWENYIMHLSPMNKAFKIYKIHRDEVESLVIKRMGRGAIIDVAKIKAFNSCPWAGACGKYCLDTSGRGRFSNVQIARSAKTIHKILDSDGFDLELISEIERKAIKAHKEGKKIAIRLNGTSDLDWVDMVIGHARPDTIFYDYTKSRARMNKFLKGGFSTNYYLTYSYDRKNDTIADLVPILKKGGKIAIMAGDHADLMPSFRDSFPTIDGDKHDLRFLDSKVKCGAFVILKEKGEAKK